MNDKPDGGCDWAADTDPFSTFLGVYVVAFQAIESELDEILLLHAGHENWAHAQERLAGLRNQQKIAEIDGAATDAERFPGIREHPEWKDRVTVRSGPNARDREHAVRALRVMPTAIVSFRPPERQMHS